VKNDERRERLEERSVLPPSTFGCATALGSERVRWWLRALPDHFRASSRARGGQLCIINCSLEQNLRREPPRTVDELATPSIAGKNLPSVFAITPTRFSTGQFQVRGIRASDCASAGDAPPWVSSAQPSRGFGGEKRNRGPEI
jgi:hypothetical protein